MTDEISKAMARLDDMLESEVEGTYGDYQAETFKNCKNLAKYAQDMILKSSSSPGELSNLSRELTDTYSGLVDSARGALATIESQELASRLKKTGYDLGEACKDLIHAGANVQGNPDDVPSKRELGDRAKVVSEKVEWICVVVFFFVCVFGLVVLFLCCNAVFSIVIAGVFWCCSCCFSVVVLFSWCCF